MINKLETFIANLEAENKAEDNETVLKNMMYSDPDHPELLGRPFSGLQTHFDILNWYLKAPTIEIGPNVTLENRVKPQLFTAVSENHFNEHVANSESVFKNFPGQKILVFDIGLSKSQAIYFKNYTFENQTKYIYKKFDFGNYPRKTLWLTGMSWKIFAHMECLIQFSACQWFDASIVFQKSTDQIVQKYVYERNSSFVYYIRPAGHTTPWATHPFMSGSGKLYKALQYSLQVQCSAVQCLAFYTGKYTELHDSRCSGIFRDNFRGRNQFQVKSVIRMNIGLRGEEAVSFLKKKRFRPVFKGKNIFF